MELYIGGRHWKCLVGIGLGEYQKISIETEGESDSD